jgi:hypothetical protein
MFELVTFWGYTCQISFFFLHHMHYSIPLFLNVTVSHYNGFTKALYIQIDKLLLVG